MMTALGRYVTAYVMLPLYLQVTVSDDGFTVSSSRLDTTHATQEMILSGGTVVTCNTAEELCFGMENTTSSPTSSQGTMDMKEFGWSFGSMEWPWWTVLQMISAIMGILGNFLVIVVVFRRRVVGRSTNKLVGSLAIADLLTSMFLIPYPRPETIPDTWGSWFYCKVFHGNFPMWTSINASIYTLVAISFDRFFAVVFPIHFNRLISQRLVSIIILLIWLGSTLIPSAGFFIFYVDRDIGRCMTSFVSPEAQLVLGCVTFTFRLIVPTIAMLITQAITVITLHRQSNRFNTTTKYQPDPSTPTFHVVARNRIVKLMIIVIVIYIVCWAPNQIAYFAYTMNAIPSSYYLSPLNRILTVLAFYNSCLNPIIYTIRHPQFRRAVTDIFICAARDTDAPIFEENDASSTKKTMSSRDVASAKSI